MIMGKFKCKYLKKSEIKNLRKLHEELTSFDIKEIASELEINLLTAYTYLSLKKRLEHVMVPEIFLQKCVDILEKRKIELVKINKLVENV